MQNYTNHVCVVNLKTQTKPHLVKKISVYQFKHIDLLYLISPGEKKLKVICFCTILTFKQKLRECMPRIYLCNIT